MRFCCVGAEYTHVHTIMGTHTQTHAHTHTGVEALRLRWVCVFRDLPQKRPTMEAKETYYGALAGAAWLSIFVCL